MSPRSEGERLNVRAVAEELGMSEKTVRGLIRAGELPAYRISRRKTYVLSGDLDRFVESRRTVRAP
jgi:excisionase family DNA binding protein